MIIMLRTTLIFILLFSGSLFANVSVVNGLTHIIKGNEGNTYKGVIELLNSDNTPQDVKIYQTDYLFDCSGSSYYNKPVSHNRSNAGWIKLSKELFTIPPNQKTSVNYEIFIPNADTLKGSYWSVVMVEGISSSESVTPGQLNLKTVIRYAIQMITNIGDTGTGSLKFINTQLEKNEKGISALIDISNDGERLLTTELSLELFNSEGASVKKCKVDKRKIFPTTSTRFIVDLGDITPDKYQAVVVADGGNDDLFGLNLNLDLRE